MSQPGATEVRIPQWMLDEGRFSCPHAGYTDGRFPGQLFCRCLICSRCRQHTGNTTQGHYWSFCRVTRDLREFHQCCPDDCELEAA